MVEQVDRIAAASMLNAELAEGTISMLLEGRLDSHKWVQAFRDHRIAAEARGMEKAANIAESCKEDEWFKHNAACDFVAKEIRAALNGGQHGPDPT